MYPSRSSTLLPRRQPTPTCKNGGWTHTVCANGCTSVLTVTAMPASSCISSVSPGGKLPVKGKSLTTPALPLASKEAAKALAVFNDDKKNPLRAAHSSTANKPLTSVAVVITGTAPKWRANIRAISLAPPMCPDKSGMTKFPFSSATRTGESESFRLTNGATRRTAIPAAPTTINTSFWEKASAARAEKPCGEVSKSLFFSAWPAVVKIRDSMPSCKSASPIFRAVSPPCSVKKNIYPFMRYPLSLMTRSESVRKLGIV